MNPSKPKFYLLKPIIIQDYIARVLTLFYTIIRRRGYLINIKNIFLERFKGFNTIIDILNPAAYL